jgi:hypothetical protein
MRRMIPIRELFGAGALTSANTDANDDDRITSVPLQRRPEITSGDLCTFSSLPQRAFNLTSEDHASGLVKSCSRRILARKFILMKREESETHGSNWSSVHHVARTIRRWRPVTSHSIETADTRS